MWIWIFADLLGHKVVMPTWFDHFFLSPSSGVIIKMSWKQELGADRKSISNILIILWHSFLKSFIICRDEFAEISFISSISIILPRSISMTNSSGETLFTLAQVPFEVSRKYINSRNFQFRLDSKSCVEIILGEEKQTKGAGGVEWEQRRKFSAFTRNKWLYWNFLPVLQSLRNAQSKLLTGNPKFYFKKNALPLAMLASGKRFEGKLANKLFSHGTLNTNDTKKSRNSCCILIFQFLPCALF